MKIPGILGGLGPKITAKIYLALAMQDSQEYPGLLISNVSFPKEFENEIIENSKNCDIMIPYLSKSIEQLKRAGADFVVIPCNTLHLLLLKLRKSFSIEFVDLIEETSKELAKKGYKKIGILSTTKTRNEKLYDSINKGIEIIYPFEEEQREISGIIVKIIRNQQKTEDKSYLNEIIKKLIKRGAENVVLACTDLAEAIKINPNVLDTTEILINSIKEKMKS